MSWLMESLADLKNSIPSSSPTSSSRPSVAAATSSVRDPGRRSRPPLLPGASVSELARAAAPPHDHASAAAPSRYHACAASPPCDHARSRAPTPARVREGTGHGLGRGRGTGSRTEAAGRRPRPRGTAGVVHGGCGEEAAATRDGRGRERRLRGGGGGRERRPRSRMEAAGRTAVGSDDREEAVGEEEGMDFFRSEDLDCPYDRTVQIRGDCRKFSYSRPQGILARC